jgi:acyl-CoA thioesterase
MTQNFDEDLIKLSPFSDSLGVRIEKIDAGSCLCSLVIKDHLRNRNGGVHGGVIYSLADIAMGVALYSMLDKDERCSTIEIKINYLRPVSFGVLVCDAKVIQKGRTISVLESEIRSDDKLIAKAIGTFSIFISDDAKH